MKAFIINILFIIISITTVKLQAQNYTFEGHIRSDTSWIADTLYITGEVIVDSNVTLTILPGTFINFTGYYAIWSYGTIKAIGTISDSIILTKTDTLFHGDTATNKGGWHGIRLMPRLATDTSVFRYCRLSNGKAVVPGSWLPNDENFPDNMGGNLYGNSFGSLIIENSNILNGIVKARGGGVYLKGGDYCLIQNSHFAYNKCYNIGGGGSFNEIDFLVIRNNIFKTNTAYWRQPPFAGGGGAGLSIWHSIGYNAIAYVNNNRLVNNFGNGPTIDDQYYRSLINGNLIANNFGGGIINGHSFNHPVYVNNTIVLNDSYYWSGIIVLSEYLRIVNSIIRGNTMDGNPTPEQIYYGPDWDFPPEVDNSNIEFGWDGPGEDNFNDDPLFLNPTPGPGPAYDGLSADWTLQDGSPCINTGTPDTTGLNLPALDLAGNPRIFGIRVDMGAYENQMVVGLPQNPLVNARLLATPNPFSDRFVVELFGTEKVKRITVYNQTGTPVRQMETSWHEGLVSIDMSGFAAGLYVLTVEYENGTVKTEKMVKL